MAVFSESDIRPPDLLAGQQTAIKKDIGFLLSRYDRFVRSPCPACRGTASRPHLEKHGFTYDLCLSCGTLFMNPRAPASLMAEFYKSSANYEYWTRHIFPASASVRRERIFRPRADRILAICERQSVRRDVLIEIGCGFGMFLEELTSRKAFRAVLGIEPSSDLARRCREKGLQIIESTVEEAAREAALPSANVVAAFEVVEHLFDPADFVDSCRQMLAAGGVLVMTCPNFEGFDIQVLGTISDMIDHEHVNYFTPSSIARLCRDHGMHPLSVETTGELDADIVRNKVLQGSFSLANDPFLKRVLMDRWEDLGTPFQEFLKSTGLSSNMTVIATKADGQSGPCQ